MTLFKTIVAVVAVITFISLISALRKLLMISNHSLFSPFRRFLWSSAIDTILEPAPDLLRYPLLVNLTFDQKFEKVYVEQGWSALVEEVKKEVERMIHVLFNPTNKDESHYYYSTPRYSEEELKKIDEEMSKTEKS